MLRREMGSQVFSAHYLQRPVPQGGALLQSEWFQFYTEQPDRVSGWYILQSWDTAAKQGLLNSFSVCTTWLVNGRDYYLLDVFRQKLTYPALRDAAIALKNRYDPRYILVEDAMTGTALAQELGSSTAPSPQLIKPEGDKQGRLFVRALSSRQGAFGSQKRRLASGVPGRAFKLSGVATLRPGRQPEPGPRVQAIRLDC